ncbi:hypothetical protein JQX13_39040 [Archangium violaceum]|uniref:hypothetical protein n=1 Tax=Archangium violaceum TaxID=83451 RepID=UPI00193B0778|nr:hypothetical protein [Archangium violaceum]QRK06076.1 hypothetical protein JQX13_39040 [Archangium violaceum]
MRHSGAKRLYDALPLVYRILDAEQGQPLRELLGIIGEELDRVHQGIDQLYDDAFIETCREELVPYLGDLVGQPVEDTGGMLPHLQRLRVANALHHRRRKGRGDTLAQVIHEACGWSAVVLEDFRRLSTTQSVQHVKPEQGGSVDVRQLGEAPEPPVPFVAHGASVRGADDSVGPRGQLNLDHVRILLSRMQVYPVERTEPWRVADGRYTFHPLGLDTHLYMRRRWEAPRREIPATLELSLPFAPEALATEVSQARAWLREERQPGARHVGAQGSLEVLLGGKAVPAADMYVRDLEHWHLPGPSHVGLRSGQVHLEQLTYPSAELQVRLGEDGPHLLRLPHTAHASLSTIAQALEKALRAASSRPAFTRARVLPLGDHLLVLPGLPLEGDPVHFEPADDDAHSLHALGLSRGQARRAAVLVSHELTDAMDTQAQGTLRLRLGEAAPLELQVPLWESPEDMAHALQEQLAGHDGWHAHAQGDLLFVMAEDPDPAHYLRAEEAPQRDAARRLGLAPRVAVDVRRGRFALSLGTPAQAPRVTWAFGRVADVGAGPYPRGEDFRIPEQDAWYAEVGKALVTTSTQVHRFNTLSEALAAWTQAQETFRKGLIRIVDSATYVPPLGQPFHLLLRSASLRLEAIEGELPTLDGTLQVEAFGEENRLSVDGLQARGLTLDGRLQVKVAHCTLLGPLTSGPNTAWQEVEVKRSLLGPVRLEAGAAHLTLRDSLVRAQEEEALSGLAAGSVGPLTVMEHCTVVGKVYVEALELARECLFTRRVRVVRRQDSQLHWSALPWSSRELPRHRCLLFSAPKEEAGPGVIASAPGFVSLSFGEPGYGRLAEGGPAELRTAAADGGEPGVFHDVHEERRLATLQDVLEEYLPASLSVGVSFID